MMTDVYSALRLAINNYTYYAGHTSVFRLHRHPFCGFSPWSVYNVARQGETNAKNCDFDKILYFGGSGTHAFPDQG